VSMDLRPPVWSDSAGANLTFVALLSSHRVQAGARLAGSARNKLELAMPHPLGAACLLQLLVAAGRPRHSVQPILADDDSKSAGPLLADVARTGQ
jgi:hypothetical protein